MYNKFFGIVLVAAALSGLPLMAQKGSTSTGPTQVKDVDNHERQAFQSSMSFTFSAGSVQATNNLIQVPAGKIMVIEQVTPYCDFGLQPGPAAATLSILTTVNGQTMIHFVPADVKTWTGPLGTYAGVMSQSLTRIYADPGSNAQVTLIRRVANTPAVSSACHLGLSGYMVNAQ